MNATLLAGLSLALLIAVLALVREVRLRRALQRLLRSLLHRWRRSQAPHATSDTDSAGWSHRPDHSG